MQAYPIHKDKPMSYVSKKKLLFLLDRDYIENSNKSKCIEQLTVGCQAPIDTYTGNKSPTAKIQGIKHKRRQKVFQS